MYSKFTLPIYFTLNLASDTHLNFYDIYLKFLCYCIFFCFSNGAININYNIYIRYIFFQRKGEIKGEIKGER
jgi:hypothetical protein